MFRAEARDRGLEIVPWSIQFMMAIELLPVHEFPPNGKAAEGQFYSLVRRSSIRRFSYGYLVTTYSQSVVSPWYRPLRVTVLQVPLPSMS